MALTALGDSFLPYARRILEVLTEGLDSARMAQEGDRGRIRLGALGSLAGDLVGPALLRFVRTHPQVDCTLKSADHEVLLQMLLDGIIDLALIAWPCAGFLAEELTPLFVLHEPVVLVAHPKHTLARRRTVTQDELVQLARPLLRLRWWPAHHPRIERLAQRSGAAMELPKETARHLVLQGWGAGFFARTYISGELAAGALREISVRGLGPLVRDSALVRRRGSPLSPAAAGLITTLRAQAEQLARG